jgi:predicted enzyme related to lactoylglutathione lyase
MLPIWVEIPVHDLDRAAAFYQQMLDLSVGEITDDGIRRTINLANISPEGRTEASLDKTANFEPCDKGPLVYFQVTGNPLEWVEVAGKIVQDKTAMSDADTYAVILNSEGNLIALYFLA